MTTALRELRQAAGDAANRYSRLVLVVGDHGAGKSALIHQFAEEVSAKVLSMGAELASGLLDVSARQRPAAAADLAGDLIRARSSSGLTIIDNIEVLFLPELHLNPLKLLQDAARNRVVVATWPGSATQDSLRFGRSPHPASRSYASPESLLVAI